MRGHDGTTGFGDDVAVAKVSVFLPPGAGFVEGELLLFGKFSLRVFGEFWEGVVVEWTFEKGMVSTFGGEEHVPGIGAEMEFPNVVGAKRAVAASGVKRSPAFWGVDEFVRVIASGGSALVAIVKSNVSAVGGEGREEQGAL